MPPLVPVRDTPIVRTCSRPRNPHKPVEGLEGSDTWAEFCASPCSLFLETQIAPNHPSSPAIFGESGRFGHFRPLCRHARRLPNSPRAWSGHSDHLHSTRRLLISTISRNTLCDPHSIGPEASNWRSRGLSLVSLEWHHVTGLHIPSE